MSEVLEMPPHTDIDFWSDEVIGNPYPYYKMLRDLGPAVWLSQHSAWAVPRHESLREALTNNEVFTSTHGCMMNEESNQAFQGAMLLSEDPEHRALRKVFSRPLLPGPLMQLRGRLRELAEQRIDELVARGSFDAVVDLAHLLPMSIVTELVGLNDAGKSQMLRWAAGIFNAFGPDTHARTLEGMEITREVFGFVAQMRRDELSPDGWGAGLYEAADKGEITERTAKAMMMDYLGPALDTTINATSSAIALFAANPEQWDLLRANPRLIPGAIDEVLRLESPIRSFGRYVTRDHDLCGVTVRQGDRALMLYSSANRDERRYTNPESFDITRDARDHFGFGYGLHMCGGMNLAKLEITVLFEILARRVKRFHVVKEIRELHNTLRGIARLQVTVEPA